MKDRHLYTLIAAVFFLLGVTNIATLYLYAQEKLHHHQTAASARRQTEKMQTEATEAFTGFHKDAQQKFLETIQVFQYAKAEQNQLKQQLVAAMTQRGKHVKSFYSNRAAGIGDAMKIIQEDAAIFDFYNQYLQVSDQKENAFIERAKPLGASLGIGEKEQQK